MVCEACRAEHEAAILLEREDYHRAQAELAALRPRVSDLEHRLAIEARHHAATAQQLEAERHAREALAAELTALRSDRPRDASSAPTTAITRPT